MHLKKRVAIFLPYLDLDQPIDNHDDDINVRWCNASVIFGVWYTKLINDAKSKKEHAVPLPMPCKYQYNHEWMILEYNR